MNAPNTDPLVSSLIYPAVVAVLSALLSFLATYLIAKNSKDKELKDQKTTLIDNLILRLNKLVAIFDALNSDIETRNLFAITTISKGQKIIGSLNGYLWSVHLLEDTQLRTQIVEAVDNADELLNEINSLENYPYSEEFKAEGKRNEINKEFRDLKIRLLQEEIIFDENLKAKYVDGVKDQHPEKLKTIDLIITELANALANANDKIKNIVDGNEKKRPLLATKIVDQKTKVRDLLLTLQTLRSK